MQSYGDNVVYETEIGKTYQDRPMMAYTVMLNAS